MTIRLQTGTSMGTTVRCDACKHWGGEPVLLGTLRQECQRVRPGQHIGPHTPAFVAYCTDPDLKIYTEEHFGCALFEPKGGT